MENSLNQVIFTSTLFHEYGYSSDQKNDATMAQLRSLGYEFYTWFLKGENSKPQVLFSFSIHNFWIFCIFFFTQMSILTEKTWYEYLILIIENRFFIQINKLTICFLCWSIIFLKNIYFLFTFFFSKMYDSIKNFKNKRKLYIHYSQSDQHWLF